VKTSKEFSGCANFVEASKELSSQLSGGLQEIEWLCHCYGGLQRMEHAPFMEVSKEFSGLGILGNLTPERDGKDPSAIASMDPSKY
jgi:hypothetical protein